MAASELSRWEGQGVAIVEIKANYTKKGETSVNAAKTKSIVIDQHLRACIELLENAPSSIAIWKAGSVARKLEKTIAALQRERQELPRVIGEVLDMVSSRSGEVEALKHRLNESERALRAAQAAEAASKSAESAAAARLTELETRLQVGKAGATTTSQAEELQQKKLQDLESENQQLRNSVAELRHTKESTAARFQELTAKYQGIAEKADQEILRLQDEVKKAHEAREAAAEAAEKMRVFQRRYDSVKSLADASKEATAAAKKQAEEATDKLSRAAELHARRLAETRTARDAALFDLEALRKEHSVLHEAFLAAGGAERQAEIVRQAAGGAAIGGAGGGGGAAATATATASTGLRHVLRSRHGWCVHARPCGAANDINKLVVLPYEDAAGLEEMVRAQGLFLCAACTAGGYFKAA